MLILQLGAMLWTKYDIQYQTAAVYSAVEVYDKSMESITICFKSLYQLTDCVSIYYTACACIVIYRWDLFGGILWTK